ncbi:hypothetical protein [Candidatus Macondimonas diazotrophica]|uniref:Uncharacterized protein n=1 Tax=Candidatus Macondimonas diazotrophica TaxID=2305248 RepID=A0A4Z0F726_9GAMM|nr:hypothetical protein [Candidatus Macondimonas diazotrophica]TFZ81297.1 hypothetical protein E4680_13095 [Candidatus Macondimonas diazotrophica]
MGYITISFTNSEGHSVKTIEQADKVWFHYDGNGCFGWFLTPEEWKDEESRQRRMSREMENTDHHDVIAMDMYSRYRKSDVNDLFLRTTFPQYKDTLFKDSRSMRSFLVKDGIIPDTIHGSTNIFRYVKGLSLIEL